MKTLLYIGANGVQCWQRDRGGWGLLADAPQHSFCAVTDLAEESLTQIQVPRLFGRDRTSYIDRQLASLYPDTPFRAALPPRAQGGLLQRLAPALQTLAGVNAAARIHAALGGHSAPLAGLWSTSSLMACLGRHPSLPGDLFVLLPSSEGLRLVFLKQREPVLARFASGAQQASEQLAELLRTLRHLENNHTLERSQRRYGVLLLGPTSELAPLLSQQPLELLRPPPSWQRSPPPDWRLALFDLALRAPTGQLAPPEWRAGFLAQRLRRSAYAVTALALGLSLWLAASELSSERAANRARAQARAQLAPLQLEREHTVQAIERVGVTPQDLHRALKLKARELEPKPSFAQALARIADTVGPSPGQRISRLHWRVLTVDERACAQVAAATGAETPARAPGQGTPMPRSELVLELRPEPELSARASLSRAQALSLALQQLPLTTLWQDPVRELTRASLSSSEPGVALDVNRWCMSWAGAVAGLHAAGARP